MTTALDRPRFPAHSPLRAELTRRVDEYFAGRGLDPHGGARMWLKSATLLGWAVGSYLLLLLWAPAWWAVVPLVVSLGLAMAGIGFAVMHDGGHGSYSSRRWLNRLAFGTLDLMGGSSYMWHHKHNVLHHSFTNVEGVDDDIDSSPFVRLSPSQRRRWFHRLQHWYVFPLVGLGFVPKWALLDDWRSWIRGRCGSRSIPRPRGLDAAQFVAGKVWHVVWALAIPLALHPVLPVLLCYFAVGAVMGITLAVVFQLAHAVEGTVFAPEPRRGEKLELPFFEHQLATTVDFSPGNRLLTWYVGGLNYQVEHHLFPRISHLHYPALAPIVREVCRAHGVPYLCHETLGAALASHWSFLQRMGAPVEVEPVVPAPREVAPLAA